MEWERRLAGRTAQLLHELRNPLVTPAGYHRLLRKALDEAVAQQPASDANPVSGRLSTAQDAATRVTELMENMLGFARKQWRRNSAEALRGRASPEIVMEWRAAGAQALIQVCDNARGLPPRSATAFSARSDHQGSQRNRKVADDFTPDCGSEGGVDSLSGHQRRHMFRDSASVV